MVFTSKYPDSIPDSKYKDSLSLFYWYQLDKFANNTLLVDFVSERQWIGKDIKNKAIKIANYLIEKVNLKPNDGCLLLYPNSDYLHIACFGVLFAGGYVCTEGYKNSREDQEYILEILKPAVLFIDGRIFKQISEIKEKFNYTFKIIIINDDLNEAFKLNGCQKIGLHKDILEESSQELERNSTQTSTQLPILVDPNQPAYVLFTSGSTGRPKPVGRSHRNSIYVCHSFDTCDKELWDLNENSVLAGHLPCDHGTGTFSIKMTLARGCKLIIMDGYYFDMMLDAITKYKITDCKLGSALLHNLLTAVLRSEQMGKRFDLSSMRNFIAVGSPIPSHEIVLKFMEAWPQCSVRQSLGMTECGFVTFVKRADSKVESRSVGWLLPNMKIKLLELEDEIETSQVVDSGEKQKFRKEITEFNKDGELFMFGPTVSPGYIGNQFENQQKLAFMPDGFYRTFDIASISPDGQLFMKGRCNDILCLDDGWKVLPTEIERELLKHPGILEVSVAGIPHPSLPTCHAPRAYVVPKQDWQGKLKEQEVIEFSKKVLTYPRQLDGGAKLMDKLPRITLGKVNKRLLLQADGF